MHDTHDLHDAHEVVGLEAADVVNGPSVHFILTFFFYYLLSILTISNKYEPTESEKCSSTNEERRNIFF
jgi:hypothetical protein